MFLPDLKTTPHAANNEHHPSFALLEEDSESEKHAWIGRRL
jgi:hypothetical protein